ncbi:MAG TPA: penicillin-binding transpeptidase domain-containing protein [Streptosporangiaceae bacterium]
MHDRSTPDSYPSGDDSPGQYRSERQYPPSQHRSEDQHPPGDDFLPGLYRPERQAPSAQQYPPGQYSSGSGRPPGGRRPGNRRRTIVIVVVAAVLVIGAGAGVGSYFLLRTKGSPQQTASTYLAAWQRGNYPAMDKVSVGVPDGGVAGPLKQVAAEAGIRSIHLAPGAVTSTGGSAQAAFTATADLISGHVWTYHGRLALVVRNRQWWVNWSPAAIYPGFRSGERFALSAAWPARAGIISADGAVLSSPQVAAESGSISLLTGELVTATAKQAKALGAPYVAGDQIGEGGIEQAYQAQLAGRPSLTIRIEGPGKQIDATAAKFAAVNGTPVHTGIDMRDQLAASQAVSSAHTSKPVDMVAIQPSTGRILAVVERPGGFDRALEGIFPPGSTFKIVTGSALAAKDMTPSSSVQCPGQVTIDGRVFHNDNNEQLGTTSLLNAFAISCNTTFALLATQRLDGPALASMATTFGYNAQPALGIPATLGKFTTPRAGVDLAADAFGQGTDLVNPLSQASEAAAIDDGSWRPPVLVTSPAPRQTASPHALPAGILAALRPMMQAVVTRGTAASVGFPPGVYGKTGTAEYGSGPHPPSHGWFIGYQGDVAFAVLVEGGGFGADSAGPIANAFLRKL